MAASVARVEHGPTTEESNAATRRKLSRPKAKRLRGSPPAPVPTPPRLPGLYTLIGDPDGSNDGIVCSMPWAEAILEAMVKGRAPRRRRFAAVWLALFRAGVYPPADPGRRSLMRVCPYCGRDCPPTITDAVDLPGRTNGACVDCVENERAPEDEGRTLRESAQGIERLLQLLPFGLGVCEWLDAQAKLKLETDAGLRKEIRRFHKGQWRPEPWRERRRSEDSHPHS